MQLLKQSSTAQPLVFLLVDSTDHVTGKTGLTPTVTLSKAGGAFASPAGAVTEIGSGWYKVAGNATDTGTLGPLILHATGTAADPVDILYGVVAFDPQDSVRAGLTALPNAAAGANTGLPVVGTQLPLALGANGNVKSDVRDYNGTAGTFTSGRPEVNTTHAAGTAWNSGAIGASTLAADTITAAKIAADAIGASELAADAVAEIQSGLSTLTQAQVTGGAYALNSASFAFNAALDFSTTMKTSITTAVDASDLTQAVNDVQSDVTNVLTHLTDIKGTGWVTGDNLHSRLDAAVSSRMATFTLPTNFSAMGINASGHVSRVTLVDTSTTLTNAVTASSVTDANVANMATRFLGMISLDGSVYHYTANALELGPTAGGYLATGTIASATSTSATLDSGALATADYYVSANLVITAGTGAGQERIITAYNASRVATVAAWTTNPDNTSTYEVRTGRSSATVTGGGDASETSVQKVLKVVQAMGE